MNEPRMTEAEFIRQIVKVHGTDKAIQMIAIADILKVDIAQVISSFQLAKDKINSAVYGINA